MIPPVMIKISSAFARFLDPQAALATLNISMVYRNSTLPTLFWQLGVCVSVDLFMHVVRVHTWKRYISGIPLQVSECMQTCELFPLGSSCGCCLMKNAAVFMLVFCCMKSLVTTPGSAEKRGKKQKKKTSYLEEVFAVCFLSGAEVRSCKDAETVGNNDASL